MTLNIIWVLFFLIAFIIALVKFIFVPGNDDIFKILTDGIFDAAKTSVTDVAFPLAGTMIFFLGLMNIAEKAGAIRWLARLLNPLMKRLFPEVPEGHPAMGEMVMNFSAVMLGLDNAATPFGLKAMNSLQTINPSKDTASNSQIMFLVLQTSGLVLIPLSIISYRIAAGSIDATSVFIPCVAATLCTTIAAIITVTIKQKIKWDITLLLWILALIGVVAGLLFFVHSLPDAAKNTFTKVAGNFFLLLLIVLILLAGLIKKVPVFSTFIEGAKEGWIVVVKILPYLVGFLVAIRMFRDSGALGYITDGISYVIKAMGLNNDFVPSLPVAIMKPFSGSGARGLMIDSMKTYGPDSFIGKLSCIFQGTSDTTFYIVALYFGSVGIKKVRYAIWAGIFVDLIGVIAAIVIGYIFFR